MVRHQTRRNARREVEWCAGFPTRRALIVTLFPLSIGMLFFLLPATAARSDDLSGWENDLTPSDRLSFQDGEIRYLKFGSPPRECETEYELTVEPPLTFVSFEFPRRCEDILHPFMRGPQRWMLLYENPGIMFAYNREGWRPLGGGYWGGFRTWFIADNEYRASSALEEGEVVYSAENLGLTESRRPWVEGVEGQGEGERITVTYREWKEVFQGLLFSIGFVSFERPELYYLNSRPRTVRIESLEPRFSFLHEFEDTPHPQFVPLPEPTAQLAVTIVDVYPGTRWEDTCVNFLIPYGGR
ncbi:MAG: NADase-type glycan-binding domain-containing protein [Spirochaetaceae bacterium]